MHSVLQVPCHHSAMEDQRLARGCPVGAPRFGAQVRRRALSRCDQRRRIYRLIQQLSRTTFERTCAYHLGRRFLGRFGTRHWIEAPTAPVRKAMDFMHSQGLDDLARRLADAVPPAMRSLGRDLESNFKAVLQARLSKLDLVSRAEFDVQTALLKRTQAALAAMEQRLKDIEAKLG
jgi:ubiquinone biosynthesis accessory factor UbiK